MFGEKSSAEGPIHIHCSVQLNPHASYGKDQPVIAIEQFLKASNP